MKKTSYSSRTFRLCLVVSALIVLWRPTIQAQEEFELGKPIGSRAFNIELQVGRADYVERVSIAPVRSEWDAAFVRLAGDLVFEGTEPLLFRLHGAFFATDSAEERWREGNTVMQVNRMESSGGEMGLDGGLPVAKGEAGGARAWLGVAYRNQSFERSGFRSTIGPDPGFGPVGERYDLLLVRAELEGSVEVTPSVFVEAAGQVGYVLFSRADNDLLGVIETRGGVVLESRFDLRWQLDERHALALGLRLGVQDLDGDVKRLSPVQDRAGNVFDRIVEWPDNRFETLAVALRWSYSF